MTRKILVIRRDNIGDLVLTTPLFAALRERLPDAQIDVLTNSYAEPVLFGNPDVDNVYVYTKAHHRGEGVSRLRVYLQRFRVTRELRRERYDAILLARSLAIPRLVARARRIGASEIVGVLAPGDHLARKLTHAIAWDPSPDVHEVVRSFRTAEHFGIAGPPGPLRLFPQEAEVREARERLAPVLGLGKRLVAVNLSSRKVRQRWPAESFARFMRELAAREGVAFMLVWSPGDAANPRHPGDDAKAREVMARLEGVPCAAYATAELRQLIAGLSLASAIVTSDGGAMHLGAGVGLPVLAFFGNSSVASWRPWGVPHEVLQPASRTVADITVDAALAAWDRLSARTGARAAA
ncbi:MAG: glycosyltransferase family 9 protein [Burkholderiales bacterium]|nr:glycosyltransferase family 9 protein [Burkholderiales bacterium]